MKKNKCGSTSGTPKPSNKPNPPPSGKSDKGGKSAKFDNNGLVFSIELRTENDDSRETIFV
jgi:hypothetical protein